MSADEDVSTPAPSEVAPRRANLTTQTSEPSLPPGVVASSEAPRVRDPERYDVICEHGRGGLGRVSRARDRELGRDVAIKELLARGVTSERRFAREALITARLEHPGIVPVYEAGRWPDGTPFYAMKLVSGRPLRALIAERKTVDERIGLLHHVIAVADAMAYAHERNVIHRDLKPANVIVGEFGETVVIDWGLAKDLSDPSAIGGDRSQPSGDDALTRAGSVLGTPAYMPPEQERGEAVDQRADVFAIGAMLWELCSLQKVPPTERAMRRRLLRRSGIDDDLAAIIDKSIDPDPGERYRHAGDLAADLKAFKSGVRISARAYSLAALLAHWARRHRLHAISAFAVIAVAAISAVALVTLYRRSSASAADALHSARQSKRRLLDTYVEQARKDFLDGNESEALPRLVAAAHHGNDSPAVRFMLERIAQTQAMNVMRLPALSPRAWQITYSKDGRRLLSADDLGAHVWDAGTGQLLFSMPHRDLAVFARFTPDEGQIITVGVDGDVKIWTAANGQLLRTLHRNRALEYRSATMSPNGRYVAAVALSGDFDIWDAESGSLLMSSTAIRAESQVVAFSADGEWFVAATAHEIIVRRTSSWRVVAKLEVEAVTIVCFSPRGARLALATSRGDLSLWDVASQKLLFAPLRGAGAIRALEFSADGELLAVASGQGDYSVSVWNAGSGTLVTRLSSEGASGRLLRFDPSGQRLAVAGNRLAVFEVATGVPVMKSESMPAMLLGGEFSPDGGQIAIASVDGHSYVWDLSRSYRQWLTPAVRKPCNVSVAYAQDGRFVALECFPGTTAVWDTAAQRQIAVLPAVADPRQRWSEFSVVTKQGDQAAIPRGDHVEVRDLLRGELLREIPLPDHVRQLTYAEAGHVLAAVTSDGTLNVSDDRNDVMRRQVTTRPLDAVAVLPHRKVLVADETPRLRELDLDTGTEMASFDLRGLAQVLVVSSDGRYAVVIHDIGHVTPPSIFDLRERRFVAQLSAHSTQVYAAAFVRGHDILMGLIHSRGQVAYASA